MKKILILINTILICLFLTYKTDAYSFGIGKIENNSRPSAGVFKNIIEKNNGFYIGKDEQSVTLTFDCGYENGYTSSMLDTLKEKNVSGTFFITGHYLNSATDLVKRMIDEGHIVANHTDKHGHFTKQSASKTLEDVIRLEAMYEQKIGSKMSKYCRPPAGEFTEESLSLLNKNGYIPSFWSLAYVDWNKDVFHGNNYSYNEVMKRLHNGAVILMHTVGKDNAVDLDKIIDGIRDKNYEIKSLKNLIEAR